MRMVTISGTKFQGFTKIGVAALSLGLLVSHSLPAVAQFSPLRAWGAGESGQMGNGQGYRSNSSPEIVNIGSGVTQISNSGQHALALKNDGTIMAWGNNGSGQLGYVSPYNSAYPQQIPNFSNVKQVAAGGGTSLAVKNDGLVWAWGSNYYGDLGHGGFDNGAHTTPTIVNSLYSIVEVAANGHEMALNAYGEVFAWGFNLFGELGTGDTTNYAYPSMVQGINNVRHIAAGTYHSLALKNDGTVWAWGHNDTAQLGDGTTTDRHYPVQVAGLSNVVAIAASNYCSIALKSDGTVWYWGFFYGFSGSNYTRTPTQMTELGFNNVKIALGSAYILTVDGDGYVWAIGDNSNGKIGDPRAGSYQYPARRLDNLYNVTAVCASDDFSLIQTEAAGVAGNIHLEGLSNLAVHQNVTLVFKSSGRPDITRTVPVTVDPYFQMEDLPRGYYSVYIKGLLWLQRVVNVDLYYGNSTNAIDITLPAGDANNDNYVDIADFAALVSAYNGISTDAASGYDYHADFNCDGAVDILDFGLLVNNYGTTGDF